jgi:Zn-finger nucleic acid-binding protein
MVGFQRGGIAVKECAGCRGVFLGRRDMERLLGRRGAVAAMNGQQPAPSYEGRHRRD